MRAEWTVLPLAHRFRKPSERRRATPTGTCPKSPKSEPFERHDIVDIERSSVCTTASEPKMLLRVSLAGERGDAPLGLGASRGVSPPWATFPAGGMPRASDPGVIGLATMKK
mmetsp:Transcript_590/g.1665  ORF Transcript_590/g.1665 Transcript_590/m.1665 type:complete len:112 (+) Transcript_590:1846-2181(+)